MYRCSTNNNDDFIELLHLYYLVVLFLIPVLIIAVLYTRIIIVLVQSIKMAQQMTG